MTNHISTVKQKTHTFRLTLSSSTKQIHNVENFFLDLNTSVHLGEEKLHALLVAITEAVNNCIIHGNKQDEAKRVTVTCNVRGHMLTVKVKDEGEGFTPDALPNPLHEENLLRSGGRGVFLMKTLMESVRYNKKGNEVTMKMKIV
mgnify:FL=1